MKIIPVGENYLVKLVLEEKKSYQPGQLILPESNQQMIYEIVAAHKDGQYPIGTKALIHKYHGQEVVVDGKDFLLIKTADIIAIIED